MTNNDPGKIRRSQYREAAARKYGVKVSPIAHVDPSIEQDGAFVEIVVWISRDDVLLQNYPSADPFDAPKQVVLSNDKLITPTQIMLGKEDVVHLTLDAAWDELQDAIKQQGIVPLEYGINIRAVADAPKEDDK